MARIDAWGGEGEARRRLAKALPMPGTWEITEAMPDAGTQLLLHCARRRGTHPSPAD